ncbi:MAG: metalloregulator ArsR/SmtB family transcription factor [Pseudomonadota bacterium]
MSNDDDIFKALADPSRRVILDALLKDDCSVTDLTKLLNMTQSAVSQHLAILKTAGLVEDRKVGRKRYYRVLTDRLDPVHDWLSKYRTTWATGLTALEDHLNRQRN